MSLLTEVYFRDIDFDQSKFNDIFSPVQKSASDIDEEVQFILEGDMFELNDTVVNFAPEDEHAATLKAMLLAQWRLSNARNEADKADALADLIIFAKSHCNVCLTAVRDSIVKG